MAIFNSYVGLPEGNVGKTIMSHPPVITMFNIYFLGGMFTVPRDLLSTY